MKPASEGEDCAVSNGFGGFTGCNGPFFGAGEAVKTHPKQDEERSVSIGKVLKKQG